jgi:hypothetical protein
MEDKSQISDGYHTFAELYEHRHALFLALVSTMPECFVMSRFHSDGKLCFGSHEWFIVIGELPTGDQISYHLPASLWDIAEKTGVQVVEKALEWNGHTSEDVVDSLFTYATS